MTSASETAATSIPVFPALLSPQQRITAAFNSALRLPLTPDSRYVLFSDCHRGTGSHNDNFLSNEPLFLGALEYYFQNHFTYLELGDGDELWENRSMEPIAEVHERAFCMLKRFRKEGRFYAIYGNHDMAKKDEGLPPAIILADSRRQKDLYLTHGHQPEFLNSVLWKFARFLVRYLWRPLEKLGIPDPTSAARNNTRKKRTEECLVHWARSHDCIVISGHTHHPMIGTPQSPYCNTGSCVHPSGITCIEVKNRCITLVKWSVGVRNDMSLYVKREVLGETVCVEDYCRH